MDTLTDTLTDTLGIVAIKRPCLILSEVTAWAVSFECHGRFGVHMTGALYQCRLCGTQFGPPAAACPSCSGRSWNPKVAIAGVAAQASVGRVGGVADGRQGNAESIDYSSPEGLRSV